jgi:hypothetical protein
MAATALKRLLVKAESAWGTPVVPSYLLTPVTEMAIRIANEHYQSAELGKVAPSSNIAFVAHSGGVSFGMDLSYEGILVPLNALDTESNTGAGPYTHTFVLPTQTAGVFTPYTFALESGDISTEWQVEGCIATGLTISSEQRSVWKATQEYIGQQVTRTSGIATPAEPVVELIKHGSTKLFVDALAGTVGTTEIPATLRSFTLNVENGRHLKWLGETIVPNDYGIGPWTGSLNMRVELNATVLAYLEAGLTDNVSRQIRIRGASGAKTVSIDFAGYLVMAPQELYQDDDGNIVADLTWQGTDNVAMGNWLKFTVVNSIAANPAA